MRIDLLSLVQNLLSPSIRSKEVIEFVRSLIMQVPHAQNAFELFRLDALYKANANASVISLEHHINREFDVRATITELDGKPIDFLVSIVGNVDENRLRSLIDSCKLFGNSYIFRIGAVAYSAEFVNHSCENIIETYTAEFVDHVCEQGNIVFITAFAGLDVDGGWELEVNATRNVMSDITIDVTVIYVKDLIINSITARGVIASGTASSRTSIYLPEGNLIVTNVVIYSITPESDNYFIYIKKD